MQTTKKLLTSLLLLGAALTPPLNAQVTENYSFATNRLLPDGNPSGLSDVRTVNSAIGIISSVQVQLSIAGEYNGDLYAYLRHSSGFTVLLNRPGRTASSLYGYPDSGLNVTFQTGAANGDIHDYENVLTPAAGLPLTGIWEPDGRIVDPSNAFDTSPRATSLTNFVGLNAAGGWTLYLADMDSGGTNQLVQWQLSISGAAYPTLSWTNPADIVYGTALGTTQLNATATYNSTNVPGTFTYLAAAGTVLNAGLGQTLSVTFTPNDTSSFLPVTTNVTINVQQAPLTITANNTNSTYGGTIPGLSASFSGFVNGDTVSSLTTQPALSTTGTSASPVGTYPISVSGAVGSNYTISYVSGTLTIGPAPLIITANSLSKLYGATMPALTASYSGFVNGDSAASLTTPPSLATTASAASPVGTYTITASGAVDANYSISYVSGNLTITTAPLMITANSLSKVYGATVPTLTASYSGLVNGDTAASLTTPPSLSTTASASSPAGTYPITASGAVDANYTISYVSGTLTINQAVSSGLVVSSANPASQGSNVTFTMTVSAVAPGAGTPTGTVNFRIDGSIAGSGGLSGGVATFSTSSLARGTHTVAAEYAGDPNFIGITNSLAPNQTIDTPPNAGTLTIERYPTQDVKVGLATVLASASDINGDTLSISVSSTSTNGGSVVVSGGWVFYQPVSGFTNVDAYSYTVTDNYGRTATGMVVINIEIDNSAGENLVITPLGNGNYQINGNGIPGRTYQIQSTPSLSPANWQSLPGGSVTADATGAFAFTDNSGTGTGNYRSVYP